MGWIGMLSFLPFATWLVFFAALAYFFRRWRSLLAVVNFPSFLLVPLSVILEESPRWLVKTGLGNEAERIFMRAYRWHHPNQQMDEALRSKITSLGNCPEAWQSQVPPSEGRQPNRTAFGHLMRAFKCSVRCCFAALSFPQRMTGLAASFLGTPFMRRITILVSVCRFLLTMVQIAILFHNEIYRSSPMLFIVTNGILYSIAIVLGLTVCSFLSRKILVIIALLGAGILELTVLAFYFKWTLLRWIFSSLAFFFVTTAQMIFWVYCPELLPSDLRAEGLALFNLINQIGFILGPLFIEFMDGGEWFEASSFLGSAALISGVGAFFLPETNGRPLCDSVEDVEGRKLG